MIGSCRRPGKYWPGKRNRVPTLTETLHHDLGERKSNVGCSLLCPAYAPTGIADSERNRPPELANPPMEKSPAQIAKEAMLQKAVRSGRLTADDIGAAVLAVVKEDRFYILTYPKINGAIRARMEDILEGRQPRNPMNL